MTLSRLATIVGLTAFTLASSGCVTVAEFRKLEHEVNRMKISGGGGSGGGGGSSGSVADLRTEVDTLRDEVARLQGRLEVAEQQATRAVEEAESARRDAATGRVASVAPPAAVPVGDPPEGGPASAELAAYREAYDAWRTDQNGACIDRFGQFLQSFPASEYADDASYWLADCYFKQGEFRDAVLRFDDVANTYPESDKAGDALYRQGEALKMLGPTYEGAAIKAFQRVIDEYPQSRRAADATRQLEQLGAG